jgi:NSS family neurotransmitter:Na+ symporter
MPEARERWNSRTAFIMAAVGSAVGLGNVWRFPATCYENGGGAFFIPYLVALLTAGIPLMILEMGIGQMMQGSAPTALRKVNRHTEWVGWFALLVATCISIYYAAIMAYAVEYLVYSFKGFFTGGEMPWTGGTGNFFQSNVLNLTEMRNGEMVAAGLEKGSMWSPVWHVILGLIATWTAVFLIICRGVHRVGKVVMWTVPIPIAVLLVLIIRGLTLDGAGEGILFYLTPDFSKLSNIDTWQAAYGQVFFSLTIGFGVMIAYASYRPQKADIANSAFITSFANCMISFMAGFAVFSVLGFLAVREGKPIAEVVSGGPGLAFVTYPTAVSKMAEVGWLWAPITGVLFFLMLLFLGIDSLFSLVEAAVSGLRDRFPWLNQMMLTGLICLLGLAVGIVVFGSRSGIMWVDTIDYWTNNYGLVIVGLLQCVIVGYFYKTDLLRDYINKVSEIKLWGWWELCVRVINPVVLGFLIVMKLIKDLGREGLYGIESASGTYFENWLPAAPILMVALLLLAILLSRLWSYFILMAGGVLVAGVTWVLLPAMKGRFAASVFCGIASAILIGGLVLCLRVASRSAHRHHGDRKKGVQ